MRWRPVWRVRSPGGPRGHRHIDVLVANQLFFLYAAVGSRLHFPLSMAPQFTLLFPFLPGACHPVRGLPQQLQLLAGLGRAGGSLRNNDFQRFNRSLVYRRCIGKMHYTVFIHGFVDCGCQYRQGTQRQQETQQY